MYKRIKKLLAVVLTIAVFITSINIGTINSYAVENSSDYTYYGKNYQITFNKGSISRNHMYDATLTIANTGNTAIESWSIFFCLNAEITNIWDAEISASSEGTYTIKNTGWNQDIAPGEEVSFGFSCIFEEEVMPPDRYELLSYEEEVILDSYSIIFRRM